MSNLICFSSVKMTSIEIAELVESRHSNVKVSIDSEPPRESWRLNFLRKR